MPNNNVYLLQNSAKSGILMRDLLDRLFRQKRWIIVAVLAWTNAMGLYLWFTPAAY